MKVTLHHSTLLRALHVCKKWIADLLHSTDINCQVYVGHIKMKSRKT